MYIQTRSNTWSKCLIPLPPSPPSSIPAQPDTGEGKPQTLNPKPKPEHNGQAGTSQQTGLLLQAAAGWIEAREERPGGWSPGTPPAGRPFQEGQLWVEAARWWAGLVQLYLQSAW